MTSPWQQPVMSLAGITTLQSIQAQAVGLELLGSPMALNREELKHSEVCENAEDFPLFFFFCSREGCCPRGCHQHSHPLAHDKPSSLVLPPCGDCSGGAEPRSGIPWPRAGALSMGAAGVPHSMQLPLAPQFSVIQ